MGLAPLGGPGPFCPLQLPETPGPWPWPLAAHPPSFRPCIFGSDLALSLSTSSLLRDLPGAWRTNFPCGAHTPGGKCAAPGSAWGVLRGGGVLGWESEQHSSRNWAVQVLPAHLGTVVSVSSVCVDVGYPEGSLSTPARAGPGAGLIPPTGRGAGLQFWRGSCCFCC